MNLRKPPLFVIILVALVILLILMILWISSQLMQKL